MAKVDVKVVMLGKEFNGKTFLVERFQNERFIKYCEQSVEPRHSTLPEPGQQAWSVISFISWQFHLMIGKIL